MGPENVTKFIVNLNKGAALVSPFVQRVSSNTATTIIWDVMSDIGIKAVDIAFSKPVVSGTLTSLIAPPSLNPTVGGQTQGNGQDGGSYTHVISVWRADDSPPAILTAVLIIE